MNLVNLILWPSNPWNFTIVKSRTCKKFWVISGSKIYLNSGKLLKVTSPCSFNITHLIIRGFFINANKFRNNFTPIQTLEHSPSFLKYKESWMSLRNTIYGISVKRIIDVIVAVFFIDALSRSCKLAETWGKTHEIY